MTGYDLPELPPKQDIETKEILKQVATAHRFLAELKGVSKTIPNQNILINTLPLLEAKESSAIENIITTHDEIFREPLFEEYIESASAKEVYNYVKALKTGFERVKTTSMLTNRQVLDIQECIVSNNAGFRKQPGTVLKRGETGEVIYTPPQDSKDILRLMANLEKYINDDTADTTDLLVKMAVIHYQFESIHPFYDGNGRTGRIINILYLVSKGLLDIPVLYLSRYIIQNKNDYYRLLQEVRTKDAWEEWILYMLQGITETSIKTIDLINKIRELMLDYKKRIRDEYKFYSQDLLNNLFYHPYTKIEFLEKDLGIHRQTAAKYLDDLVKGGFLKLEKIAKYNYYVNVPLFELFTRD